ncbi:MAG: hypothetical protein F4Y01_13510 [Gammaproteobacteria bacterium]|nr:hypothetical protein [Gammaproteobacteria bacterium]
MDNKYPITVRLGRLLESSALRRMGENVQDNELRVYEFTLKLRVTRAGPEGYEAISDVFGGMLVGVGSSRKSATEDLLAALMTTFDFHIERGTYLPFISTHVPKARVKTETSTLPHPRNKRVRKDPLLRGHLKSWKQDVPEAAHALAS